MSSMLDTSPPMMLADAGLSGLTPEDFGEQIPHRVCEEEYQRVVQKFFDNESLITVETPPDEMAKVEELLEARPGFFSTPYVIKTEVEHCPNCGRRNTFLDVVHTALKGPHSPSFLLKVFTGQYGRVVNDRAAQRCVCFECGTTLPPNATKFSAPKPTTDGVLPSY
eukprot:TRINITY_DN25485_c0_g1_i1.p1 TRINITY_DN25485_c0_g1~~TRINITY_DN25485_c0_g1_i1.p1  ORF type:complete len:166 (-),score=14.71 TRINITY_DN25485_c0_g1_i1:245-742(-)